MFKKHPNASETLLDDIAIMAELTKGVPIPQKAIGLETAVTAAISQLSGPIDQTKANITISTPLPFVHVELKWATLAIFNLLENSIKYAGTNKLPDIEICAHNDPKGLGVAIKDRGPGIPNESISHMFKLFKRGVSRDISGTGSGLTIARQIARAYDGDSWIVNRNGGGTIIYLLFSPQTQN